jgi:type II secretory pathway pseudopilin PulG
MALVRPFYGRRPRRGFTFISLLLCVSAGGLLLALLFPIFEHARDTATLRATLADMNMWRGAMERYISDHGAAPTNPNGKIRYKKPILREMLPYLDRVRSADWWGGNYWIWTGAGTNEYGLRSTGPADYLIVSLGKGCLRENWRFDPAHPRAGYFEICEPSDFEKDIVLWNGLFVRYPVNP